MARNQTFKKERNLKIEVVFAFLTVFLGILLDFSLTEWLLVLLLIAVVLSAEIFNSSIENICNLLREKLNLEYEETKNIRDVAAGAVFLISCFAALIGIIIVMQKL